MCCLISFPEHPNPDLIYLISPFLAGTECKFSNFGDVSQSVIFNAGNCSALEWPGFKAEWLDTSNKESYEVSSHKVPDDIVKELFAET